MNGRHYVVFLAALTVAACSDSPTGPGEGSSVDGELETWVLSTLGVTSDQANAGSVLGDAAWVQYQPLTGMTTCSFDAASGRNICSDVQIDGLTISRSFAFYDANGNAQPTRTSTTVAVNTRVWVRGTIQRDSVTATLDRRSDLTASGIQQGSTRRTLDGVEQGSSQIVARLARGTFRSSVTHADTTRGLVFAQNDPAAPRWPLGGTIVRTAEGTRSRDGSAETHSFTRREVISFDGSGRASLTRTVNGVTRNCIIDLSARRVTCS